jgi:hypothetical protein
MQSYKHFCLVFFIFLACKLLGNSDGSKVSRAERNRVEIEEEDLLHYDALL